MLSCGASTAPALSALSASARYASVDDRLNPAGTKAHRGHQVARPAVVEPLFNGLAGHEHAREWFGHGVQRLRVKHRRAEGVRQQRLAALYATARRESPSSAVPLPQRSDSACAGTHRASHAAESSAPVQCRTHAGDADGSHGAGQACAAVGCRDSCSVRARTRRRLSRRWRPRPLKRVPAPAS